MSEERWLSAELERIVVRGPQLWDSLRGASIFLTGGTGWFGRWLLETIAYANRTRGTAIDVLALSRNPERFTEQAPHLARNPAIAFLRGDVKDFAFPPGTFSHVIHAAATSAAETFGGESALAKFDTLVTGTRRVLDFAAQKKVGQFLFTSSGVAYGTCALAAAIGEEQVDAPLTTDTTSALGQAKRASEFLCAAYAETQGLNLSIARCFSFVGPFQPLDLHYAIGNFIERAVHKQNIVIRGDGTPLRSYLYSGDLVTWLLTLLQRKGRPELFNVGSDVPISIADLAALVRKTTNTSAPIEILGDAQHGSGNPVRGAYIPNIERARTELGLDVWTPLTDAILLTAHYAALRGEADGERTRREFANQVS